MEDNQEQLHGGPASENPSVIDPQLQAPLEGYLDRRPSHAVTSGLDHLALLASQQNSGVGTMDATMTDAARTPLMPADGSQGWNFDGHGINHDPNYESQRMASSSNLHAINTPSNTASRFDLGNHLNFGRHNAMQTQISPGMGTSVTHSASTPHGGIAQDRPDLMPHELQTWFDQFDMESQMQSDMLQDFGSATGMFYQDTPKESPVAAAAPSYRQQAVRPGSPSPSVVIPNERFAKVQRCWPNRPSNARRLMLTLWRDAVLKAEDNLFSTANLTPEAVEQNRQCGSRWGLDDDCRDRLQAIFVTTDTTNTDGVSDSFQSPEGLSPSSGRASTEHTEVAHSVLPNPTTFPPAEIFDIGKDNQLFVFSPRY